MKSRDVECKILSTRWPVRLVTPMSWVEFPEVYQISELASEQSVWQTHSSLAHLQELSTFAKRAIDPEALS